MSCLRYVAQGFIVAVLLAGLAAPALAQSERKEEAGDAARAAEEERAVEAERSAEAEQAAEAERPTEADIDFGDDSGRFANDGECDDIRFEGDRGRTASDSSAYITRDATDCRNLFLAGRISLDAEAYAAAAGVDFGDDSGDYANDGDCDDTRFEGDRGRGALDNDSHIMRDATDCRNLFLAGRISLDAEAYAAAAGVDFGDDSGDYANDGDCDDTRFEGDRGRGALDNDSHIMGDATDCRNLFLAGKIWLR